MPKGQSKTLWLFWLVVAALVFLVVPYGFMGEIEPRYFGIPRWLYVSLAATTVITILSIVRIWKFWQ